MVYIQANEDRTRPHHFDCACALFGALDNCVRYRLTTFDELSSGKFDLLIKDNLFVGSVEFMREVFNRIGIGDVRLPSNSNRTSYITTLKEALDLASTGTKLFIKPVEIKLFSGFVLDRCKYSCLNGLPDDTKLFVYEPFASSICSEWRLYIHNNIIEDSKNYSGAFTISPNYDYALNVVRKNIDSFPRTYTIDIAILENGENVVVEYNDMWAIGNYGVPNHIYVNMLKDRYFEIVGNTIQ